MLANNETGVVHRLGPLAAVVAEAAPGAAPPHRRGAGVNWLDVAALAADADLVSLSAHKFGGPKGIGALAVRDGVPSDPQLVGGGQERERRSGTQNVAGAVGMAVALRAAHRRAGTAPSRGARARATACWRACSQASEVPSTRS